MVQSVNDFLAPNNTLRILQNSYTDTMNGNQLGNIKSMPGYSEDFAVLSGKPILGMTNFRDSDQNPNFSYTMVTANDSGDTKAQTFFWDGSTLREVGYLTMPTNWTAGNKMRYATLLNYVFAVDGNISPKSWDGDPGTGWGSTHLTNAPTGSLIVNFNDTLHIANGSTLYSAVYDALTGTLIWDPIVQALPVNVEDGDYLSALEPSGSLLLLFKRGSLLTWNGLASEANPIIDVGTISQETVATVKGYTYFISEVYNTLNLMMYVGQYPINIGEPVQRWLDLVPSENYGNLAIFKDNDNVYFYLGDITYDDGITYPNVVFRYSVSKQTFSFLSIPDEITCFTIFRNTELREALFGTTEGKVMTWNSGGTFNGDPINVVIRTKKHDFGIRTSQKTITRLGVLSQNPQGAIISARCDDGEWVTLGKLVKPWEQLDCRLVGYYIEFQITNSVSNEAFTFEGFEFLAMTIDNPKR